MGARESLQDVLVIALETASVHHHPWYFFPTSFSCLSVSDVWVLQNVSMRFVVIYSFSLHVIHRLWWIPLTWFEFPGQTVRCWHLCSQVLIVLSLPFSTMSMIYWGREGLMTRCSITHKNRASHLWSLGSLFQADVYSSNYTYTDADNLLVLISLKMFELELQLCL